MWKSPPTCCARRCRRSLCWTNGWRESQRGSCCRIPRRSRRRLMCSGRLGARSSSLVAERAAPPSSCGLLDATGALYLDTQESRGLVPADHPATVAAVRAATMTEADVVLLIGRKLDYQVGYGSPAVFPQARFIRLADNAGELIDNRRGQVELLASPDLALAAMVETAGNRAPEADAAWLERMRRRHGERVAAAAGDKNR